MICLYQLWIYFSEFIYMHCGSKYKCMTFKIVEIFAEILIPKNVLYCGPVNQNVKCLHTLYSLDQYSNWSMACSTYNLVNIHKIESRSINVCVNHSLLFQFQIHHPDQGCLHHWWWSSHTGSLRCHWGPASHSMMLGHILSCMVVGSGCMDRGRNTENVAVSVHGYINLSGTGSSSQRSSSSVTVGNSSSSSSSLAASWKELSVSVSDGCW